MRKSLPRIGEKRNVWRLIIFSGCIALVSLFGVGYGKMTRHSSPPQIHQVYWPGAMEDLNLEAFLFYPSNDTTRFFGSKQTFADPFVQTTDVFIPTVTAIKGQKQTITLSIVVKLPSGTSIMTVPNISNKTALYLSIPDQQGALKTSHVPFCYVWGMRWGPENRSVVAVIDYTDSGQIGWM